MIRVVRLGSPRVHDEGLRIGTVRRPPRGVHKEEFASRNYFDVWLPELAPPSDVVTSALSEPWTEARWNKFAKQYRRQMNEPPTQRLLALLAAMSEQTNFSVGCYCEDESRCHRSLLRELLIEHGAKVG
jgi:uncharacterized protein YeaO (DUF488 family)